MKFPVLSRWPARQRLPVILQVEESECGLASLAMVAAYHGQQGGLAALRRRFAISLKGATLESLIRIARNLHLETRPLRLEMEHLPQLRLPCVIHWNMNHFVVLASVGRRSAVIHDPALGKRTLSLSEFAQHFTGVALEVWPTTEFAPGTHNERIRLRDLVGQTHGLKRGLLQIVVLGLALELFAILLPFQLQWVVDKALQMADHNLLTAIGTGFLGLVLLQAGIGAARDWFIVVLNASMSFQWMGNVFAHLVRLPMAYFDKRHVGHIQSCFGSIETIQRTLTTTFISTMLDGLLALGTLAMMLFYSPMLAAVSVVPVAGYLLLRMSLFRAQRSAVASALTHEAKQRTHFMETAIGMQSVKLFDRSEERRIGWLNTVAEQFHSQLAANKLGIVNNSVNTLMFGAERVIVVWLAALLVMEQRFTLGMLFAYLAFKEQFAMRIAALVDALFELRMLGVHAERVADIVFTQTEQLHPAPQAASLRPAIELRDIHYRYSEHEPDVLHGVSLRIEPGECVAIAGPSGGGKTTLVKVMLGLLEAQRGEHLIDGIPLQHLGVAALRANVGTVMQDDHLFSGSIADNICFFDPDRNVERINDCAMLAAVHDDILAMPMGYETLVGNLSSGLSGGQIQRILLARALYKKPQILVLDEATSHLDLLNERRVNDAVRAMQLTRIIVAHRPETIAMAQRVLRIEGGRIVEPVSSTKQMTEA